MHMVANVLVFLIAVLHIWFLILEMFLWKTPRGLKIFGNSQQQADSTATLAANQGLYNGFLAAGLLMSFVVSNPSTAFTFRIFLLSCIIIAGIYGGWSVGRKILFIQAVPAALALLLVFRFLAP